MSAKNSEAPGGDQSGAPDPGEHGPGPADQDIEELRVLLERVVPQLPPPARRMDQVRARVRRRARLRAAGLSVTAVLAVAAAGLLVPDLGGTHDTSATPVRSSTGTAAAPPASSGVPTPTSTSMGATAPPTSAGSHSYTFPELSGLRLALPSGWTTLRPPGTDAVFVSSQQLAQPPGGCAHALDGFCTPLAKSLAPGGVLLMLRPQKGLVGKFLPNGRVSRSELLDACRGVGGTDQLFSMAIPASGSPVPVSALACLSRPTAAQLQQFSAALANADFM